VRWRARNRAALSRACLLLTTHVGKGEQRRTARLLGTSPSRFSQWVRGERKWVSDHNVYRLAVGIAEFASRKPSAAQDPEDQDREVRRQLRQLFDQAFPGWSLSGYRPSTDLPNPLFLATAASPLVSLFAKLQRTDVSAHSQIVSGFLQQPAHMKFANVWIPVGSTLVASCAKSRAVLVQRASSTGDGCYICLLSENLWQVNRLKWAALRGLNGGEPELSRHSALATILQSFKDGAE
jgi:hypothetical protein